MTRESKRIGVVVLSDVRLYREGLARVLAEERGLEILASCDAVPIELSAALESDWDVMLVDMATAGALQIVRLAVGGNADRKVVALGVSKDRRQEIVDCAEAGVSGYVFRDDSVDNLVEAVRGAADDKLHCSGRVAAILLQRVASLADRARADGDVPHLTRRELEVVGLIDEGLTNKEIASRLCIEVTTVKNHVHNILEKLEAATRTQAATKARRLGLISPFRLADAH